MESKDKKRNQFNILILNTDFPIFPGRVANEYLNTTRLVASAHKVGLVSLIHTHEQVAKKSVLSNWGVFLYCWENPSDYNPKPVDRPVVIKFIRQVGKAFYALARGIQRPEDTLIQDLQFRNISNSIRTALNAEFWQALVVIQSTCANWVDYLPNFPASILVMHDVRARVYERRALNAISLIERLRFGVEAWRYRNFEKYYCNKYDLIVTVSAADEEYVRKNYAPRMLVNIPLPTDGEYFAPLSGISEAPTRIVFTGMMNHEPNVDAVSFFAKEVLPLIQEVIKDAEFWIVGREPSPAVQALGVIPGVLVTGFVSDIRPYIAQAAVFVVPLRFGAGMRTKILEAWGMQKCVISKKVGAEGLEYQDGKNILIADDACIMANKVIKALQTPSWRDEIRMNGREVVLRQHHPDDAAQKYYQSIEKVVCKKKHETLPMRVLIDLHWMRPGVSGGIENLSRSFLKQLFYQDAFNHYQVMLPGEMKYGFDLRGHSNFEVVSVDGPRRDFTKLAWQADRFLHRILRLDYWRSLDVEQLRLTKQQNTDVVLSPSGYIRKEYFGCPSVLIVHDLLHEFHPDFFSAEVLNERIRVFSDSIKQATRIIAVSEFTRQTVLDRFKINPELISTSYQAADPVFYPENRNRQLVDLTLRKFNLSKGDYLLFPANTWPHKNHQLAFKALRILSENYHLRPLLVCTGTSKEAYLDLIKLLHDEHLSQQVRFLGYCSQSEMPALYEGAAALVYPSLFEGFGIPLLEAMWCDCPIICSNVSSLPEIAGNAALFVDPKSPEELAERLYQVLTDTSLSRKLVSAGRIQVQKYSWQNFTLDIVHAMRLAQSDHLRV